MLFIAAKYPKNCEVVSFLHRGGGGWLVVCLGKKDYLNKVSFYVCFASMYTQPIWFGFSYCCEQQ